MATKKQGDHTSTTGGAHTVGGRNRCAQMCVDATGGRGACRGTRLVRDLVTWQQQQAVNAPQLTERINRAFQQYDRNRNGKISGAELRPALEGLGVPADRAGVKEALARFGTPGKELDVAEFGRLVKEALAAKGVEEAIAAATPDRLRQIFSRFDKDGSGTIDFEEFKEVS